MVEWDAMYAAIYLVSALLVGLLAIGQRGGFVIYFVLAVGVSPILALLILILPRLRARRGAFPTTMMIATMTGRADARAEQPSDLEAAPPPAVSLRCGLMFHDGFRTRRA